MGVENGMFRSEKGSGFGEMGGTPLPRIPRSTRSWIICCLNLSYLLYLFWFQVENGVDSCESYFPCTVQV